MVMLFVNAYAPGRILLWAPYSIPALPDGKIRPSSPDPFLTTFSPTFIYINLSVNKFFCRLNIWKQFQISIPPLFIFFILVDERSLKIFIRIKSTSKSSNLIIN